MPGAEQRGHRGEHFGLGYWIRAFGLWVIPLNSHPTPLPCPLTLHTPPPYTLTTTLHVTLRPQPTTRNQGESVELEQCTGLWDRLKGQERWGPEWTLRALAACQRTSLSLGSYGDMIYGLVQVRRYLPGLEGLDNLG